ncbi:MAG: tRNA uridine-5-carboxymethylaminomethyl(34) synthesis GTPase MnmE [Clostridia bacterium]|nr:tRNA uridine-5-carboxymethylaminomethyl(34) synthesis GTPase MnmE [Clostridia bacterium]
MYKKEPTIAAISTAYGESGIGIIRMSGSEAKDIVASIFVDSNKNFIASEMFEHRKMRYGFILNPKTQEKIDEVLCVFMKGPETYTAEDVVEIHCHGNMFALKKVLELCIFQGAQPAEPGEFTKRAFLNGRIDLAQAEAVIDLIKAKSEKSFDVAIKQVDGHLSLKVETIRNQIKELLILLTVTMDFPDEDIEEVTYEDVQQSLKQISNQLDDMLLYAHEGRILREGLSVAIVGKPNVGKSSLMNFFMRENRSIVTEIPGTTRDTVEEQISLKGIPIRLVDTAGIRDSSDLVEQLGIQRSKEAFNKADLLLFLIDASNPLSKEDEELSALLIDKPCIVLLNKTDLPAVIKEEQVRVFLPKAKIILTSLLDGVGLTQLEDNIEEYISGGKVHRNEDVLVTNVRHIHLINKANAEIKEALQTASRAEAIDLIEINVRLAFEYLGEITGQTARGEILEEIFSRFCLGK